MTPDPELLRSYTEKGDEAAFAELVRRHLNLVYATALRVAGGNTALAEDATQAVFTNLARKAGALRGHPTLSGWLHTSARYAALAALRNEHTRRKYEQEATAMTDPIIPPADHSWGQLRPLLDDALGRLRERDRDIVLLRFFQDKSYREIGEALGLSENTAHMRVERALEKLRAQFARRGVATTAALLATALGACSRVAPPASLADAVRQQSLSAAAIGSHGRLQHVGAKRWRWLAPLAALLVLSIVFLTRKSNPPHPEATLAPLAQQAAPPAPIQEPKVAPVPAHADTTVAPQNVQNLGKIVLNPPRSGLVTGPFGPQNFTLKSGLTFTIKSGMGNDNGSIMLVYGAYEAGKPHWRTSMTTDFRPPPVSDLNNDYQIMAEQPGVPIMITFANGETVSFTPDFTPVVKVINDLGVVQLVAGHPLKFTLHSGKIFRLELDGPPPLPPNLPPGVDLSGVIGEIRYAVFASEADYAAGKITGSSGGAGVQPSDRGRQFKDIIDDAEVVTYTPEF